MLSAGPRHCFSFWIPPMSIRNRQAVQLFELSSHTGTVSHICDCCVVAYLSVRVEARRPSDFLSTFHSELSEGGQAGKFHGEWRKSRMYEQVGRHVACQHVMVCTSTKAFSNLHIKHIERQCLKAPNLLQELKRETNDNNIFLS